MAQVQAAANSAAARLSPGAAVPSRDAAATLDYQLGAEEASTVRAALVRGKMDVAGLVSRARDDARRRFEELQPSLAPRVRAEAARRLAEVDRRLEMLTCAPA